MNQETNIVNYSGGDSVAATRSMKEVEAQIVLAKKFPRNVNQALIRIKDACKRRGLAKVSQYQYPRGGQSISGPSIRLAEVIAQNWGNIDYGVREISSNKDESVVEAYCWDMETNVRVVKAFKVTHEIKARGAIKKLTDPRDIYEAVANNGARRLRACILEVIPPDIVEEAVEACNHTLTTGHDKPLQDRVRITCQFFHNNFGVTVEHIEKRLGHSLEAITELQLVELNKIYNSIKDKMSSREQWFDFPKTKEPGSDSDAAKKLNSLGKGDKKTDDKDKVEKVALEVENDSPNDPDPESVEGQLKEIREGMNA